MAVASGSDQVWACTLAIDFGTSCSGYAYALETSDSHVIELREIVNSKWEDPNQRSISTWKTPTSILLTEDEKFHSFGYEAENNYAQDPERPWYYFSQFKMLLYDTRRLDDRTTITAKNGKAMNAIYIFSLSIKYIIDRAMQQILLATSRKISSENEAQISADMINKTLFVLTVPAIWSDKAKCFMRKAADTAGIPDTNLRLVLEPEAASMYCRHAPLIQEGSSFEAFKPGTSYILVDIGGGTVDIATHKVQQDERIVELYNAVGNNAGGNKFNKHFRRFLKNAFDGILKTWKQKDPQKYLKMMREIDNAKYCASSDTENISISLSKSLEYEVKSRTKSFFNPFRNMPDIWNKLFKNFRSIRVTIGDEMSISNDQVKAFFKDTVTGVVSEIDPIVKAFPDSVDAIILVGGVSSSAYIRQKVQEHFPTTPVIVPEDPQKTIVSGAVLLGQKPQFIAGRIARFTYGIGVASDFVQGKHNEDYKFTRDGEILCRNVFHKIIEKGQLLKYRDIFSKETHIPAKQADTKKRLFQMYLYQSPEQSPMYVTNDGCTLLGKIEQTPPKGGWPDHTDMTVEIVVGEAEFKFHVKDTTNNREYETMVDFLIPNT